MECIFCGKELEDKAYRIGIVSENKEVQVVEDVDSAMMCYMHATMMLKCVQSRMSEKNVARHRNAVEKREKANKLRREGKSVEYIADELDITVASAKQYTSDYTRERTRKIEQYIGEGLTIEEISDHIGCDLGMTRRLVGTAERLMTLRKKV